MAWIVFATKITIMKIGKGRVLIETGLVFLNQLFKYKFINNLYLFKSSKFLHLNGLIEMFLKILNHGQIMQKITKILAFLCH